MLSSMLPVFIFEIERQSQGCGGAEQNKEDMPCAEQAEPQPTSLHEVRKLHKEVERCAAGCEQDKKSDRAFDRNAPRLHGCRTESESVV